MNVFYLICLRFTRGSTIRGQVQSRENPGWKDTFAIDDKGGEFHQMQITEAWFQGEQWSHRCRGQACFQGEHE
jgi:hypothetical protein